MRHSFMVAISICTIIILQFHCAEPIDLDEEYSYSSMEIRFASGNFRLPDCQNPLDGNDCPSDRYAKGDDSTRCDNQNVREGKERGLCYACLDSDGAWLIGSEDVCVCKIGYLFVDGGGSWNTGLMSVMPGDDTQRSQNDYRDNSGCVEDVKFRGMACTSPTECPESDYFKGDQVQCEVFDSGRAIGRCKACMRDGGAWLKYSDNICVCPSGRYWNGDSSSNDAFRDTSDWFNETHCEAITARVISDDEDLASTGPERDRNRDGDTASQEAKCLENIQKANTASGWCSTYHGSACIESMTLTPEMRSNRSNDCRECVENEGTWNAQSPNPDDHQCDGAPTATQDPFSCGDLFQGLQHNTLLYSKCVECKDSYRQSTNNLSRTFVSSCSKCTLKNYFWSYTRHRCTSTNNGDCLVSNYQNGTGTVTCPNDDENDTTDTQTTNCTGECASCEATGGTWIGGFGGSSCLCAQGTSWDPGAKKCEAPDAQAGGECSDNSGICIDINTQGCYEGQGTIVRGLCPGADNVRCCRQPSAEGDYDAPDRVGDACTAESKQGICRDASLAGSCNGGHFVSNKCRGPEQVKCCIADEGDTLPDDRPACSNANVLAAMLPDGGVSSWSCKTSSACSKGGSPDDDFTCPEDQVCCMTVVKTLCPTGQSKYSCVPADDCERDENPQGTQNGVVKTNYTCSTGTCCYKSWK